MAKRILYLLSFLVISLVQVTAQAVVLQREAELMDEGYTINGTAFLEELDNGDVQLRISSDYSTPAGPDVRIFLNNSISISGAVEIVNISDIGYFSGEMTFPIPDGIGINDYDNIVFFCLAFNQLWASGTFDAATPPGGGFVCEDSGVTLQSGANTNDICPSDNQSDILAFSNTLDIAPGTNYAYLITDEFETLQEVIYTDNYDFEGSSDQEQRVYGVHFDGTLNPAIGQARTNTTATGCATHSDATNFVTITKNACPPPFECLVSNVSAAGNISSIDICPTDGASDFVTFVNSINEFSSDHYAYLITDQNEIVQEIVTTSLYDFEDSTTDEQRVYGIHYDGDLIASIGLPRTATTSTGCFEHSSNTGFLTITKNACPPIFECLDSEVSLMNGDQNIEICPTDGMADVLTFANDVDAVAGQHYAYLITNESEILLEVVTGTTYDFESSGALTQRVYGIHYDGDLMAQIGEIRTATTATECHVHSSPSAFVTVTKGSCPTLFECLTHGISLENGDASIEICPTDGDSNMITLSNTIDAAVGPHFAYLVTDQSEIVQAAIMQDTYDFEGSGIDDQRVYGIHYDGDLDVQIGQPRTMTTASECFEHSNPTQFVTILKSGCPPVFECIESSTATTQWVTSIEICPNDDASDVVELKNTLMIPAGDHYAYLITDDNDILQEVVLDDEFDFEGSGDAVQRVYGIHFDGDLVPAIGEPRTNTTATACFEHSGDLFLTVNKGNCPPTFDCLSTLTATTGWAIDVEICPNDGFQNLIELRNNQSIAPGLHYIYLITDTNEVVQEYTVDTLYDFEGSGLETQRVYGVHFDGDIDIKIGEDRHNTTATGCFEHSGGGFFLTINKIDCAQPAYECLESLTASEAWVTQIDICTTDGREDPVLIQNNIGVLPGEHYAFLMTDTDEILLEVVYDTIIDFEGTGIEDVRIYGISYDGELQPAIGDTRKNTTASKCFIHSGDNLFIAINKTADCATATNELSSEESISVFPNPSTGLFSVEIEIEEPIVHIALIDINGITTGLSTETRQTITAQPGFYILQVTTGSRSFSERIIVVE